MERNREDAIWNENAFLVALTLSRFVYVEISIAEEFEKNSFALAKKKMSNCVRSRNFIWTHNSERERKSSRCDDVDLSDNFGRIYCTVSHFCNIKM